MRKDEFEVKEHLVTEKVCVAKHLICDCCKKEIPKGGYYALMIGHNDWGNDSCDSIQHLDLCSPICLQSEMNKYIERSCDRINTEYFEVSREYWNDKLDK